ncbi:hypothetical protein NW762_006506 [Fusarium torreyae]|uniref:Beta-lactamase-related domain-containing protein n=1 Tax=Fusarium torreyae TaxID=1237075 RepID=A0A9W8VDP9_9HYPO|nr:hypothetical protein NW762_006506 [Fusarium torreyae]
MRWKCLALTVSVLGFHARGSAKDLCEQKHSNTARLNHSFDAAVREKHVPGIAAIALNRDGGVIFKNAWGTINLNDPSSAPINSSTKMQIASMTKAVTAVAALQLIKEGRLSFDDLVETYLPAWKNISVLTGFDDKGKPLLRGPKTKATILNLFTHTSGQPYAFLNNNIQRWTAWAQKQPGTPPPTPLAADPASGWFYGGSLDTLGNVIETISGLRLDAYIDEHIFRPLGIRNSGLITPDIYSNTRLAGGSIISSAPKPVDANATAGGGAYLTSTLDDYSTFLVTLLNWGTHPQTGVTILKSSTVKHSVFADLIPRAVPGYGTSHFKHAGEPVGVWISNNPSLSLNTTFLPHVRKGWSAAFLINGQEVRRGREQGSGAWAGINNLYYWADIKSGKIGIIFTNPLPFLDPEVLELFAELEELIYSK